MKTVKIAAVVLVAALSGLAFTTVDSVKDASNSSIKWLAKKVTGQHEGTINFQKMDIQFDDAGTLTSANFTVDMTSINVTDLEGKSKGDLEGHLNSADFFNTAEYPVSGFKATSIKSLGKGMYQVTGDLTIKDITNPISFSASAQKVDGKVVATAKVTVDRSKYDVRYGSGSFFEGLGDKMIYDEFDLEINVTK